MKTTYLDYAAATPVDRQVLAAMQPFFIADFYNPSATYLAGRAARKALDKARSDIAQNLGARPAEVIFTAGATEANNLAVQGVMKRFPDGEVLVSAIEHESVLAPAGLFKRREIPVTGQGIVDLAKLEKMISNKTVLVSVMLVNNELGTIQPIREIKKILNKSSILLHTDAAQAPLYLDLQTARLGADLLTINGGKIYGPKQSGALYVKAGTKLQPLILGGGQEYGLRSGTENIAAAVGLAKAFSLAQAQRIENSEEIRRLRNLFIAELQQRLPEAVINGSAKHSAPHILSVTFPGVDNERLMMQLDEAGIQAAVGSACSASSAEPSHVLSAIGLTDKQSRATLRFSFGAATTPVQLRRVAELLAGLAAS